MAVVSLLAAGNALAQTANPDGSETVWAATMTVGTLSSTFTPGLTYFGFDEANQFGSLEPNEFTYDSESYLIRWLRTYEGQNLSGCMTNSLNIFQAGSAGLGNIGNSIAVLQLGGHSFPFADAVEVTGGFRTWCDVPAAELYSVDLVSAPANGTDYLPDEAVRATATFGKPVAVAPSAVSASEDTLTLTLADAPAPGQDVSVSYMDPTPGDDPDAIQDARAGNDAETFTQGVPNPSQDDVATLRDLTIANATETLLLDRAFDSALTEYTAPVGDFVDTLTVKATPTADAAAVAFLDATDTVLIDADAATDDFQVSLPPGMTAIKVRVTSVDATAMLRRSTVSTP